MSVETTETERLARRAIYLQSVADREVLDAAIVDAYRWVNPPWGEPPVPALVEDFRGDLVDSLHRHGLVITTRSRFDELKSKEMVYEPIVKNLVTETRRLFPEWVAAIARITSSPDFGPTVARSAVGSAVPDAPDGTKP